MERWRRILNLQSPIVEEKNSESPVELIIYFAQLSSVIDKIADLR